MEGKTHGEIGIILGARPRTVANHLERIAGRPVEHRTVSRTLLVKGLEFEHAVVLNGAEHDVRNLYVAMTRGSKSLTVLSESPTMRPPLSMYPASG